MEAVAKLILFGEHSVVYGKKAIAIPVREMSIKAYIQDEPIYESEHIKFIKSLLGIKKYVRIESSIPSSRGLGSSAALSISMARLVKEKNELEIANLAEIKAHGNPSGIDSAVISSEKPIIFQKGKENKHIELNLNAYIVIIDSGIKGNTKKAVELVAKLNRKDLIEELGKLTEDAIKVIEKKDLFKLGQLFKVAQKKLRMLRLSNKKIDYITRQANFYSLGSKITGSGLGGCVIALCKDKEQAQKLVQKLNEKGIKKSWIIRV